MPAQALRSRDMDIRIGGEGIRSCTCLHRPCSQGIRTCKKAEDRRVEGSDPALAWIGPGQGHAFSAGQERTCFQCIAFPSLRAAQQQRADRVTQHSKPMSGWQQDRQEPEQQYCTGHVNVQHGHVWTHRQPKAQQFRLPAAYLASMPPHCSSQLPTCLSTCVPCSPLPLTHFLNHSPCPPTIHFASLASPLFTPPLHSLSHLLTLPSHNPLRLPSLPNFHPASPLALPLAYLALPQPTSPP